MALGSTPGALLTMVLGQGLTLAATGLAIGVVGVFAANRLTASLVYGLSPTEPKTLVGGIVVLAALGLLSSIVPAGRATRIDPVLALREEEFLGRAWLSGRRSQNPILISPSPEASFDPNLPF
jgi:putative ABC transport system permease protein